MIDGSELTQPPFQEREVAKPLILFHQTTREAAEKIVSVGFQRGFQGSAGVGGPIRGIFLKDTPELLVGPRMGETQVEVSISPAIKVLDLTDEEPASFMHAYWLDDEQRQRQKGRQEYALTGWLERNGHKDLALRYNVGLKRLFNRNYGALDEVWEEVETVLKENEYSGVKFTDGNTDKEGVDKDFPATVIFNPEEITVRGIV